MAVSGDRKGGYLRYRSHADRAMAVRSGDTGQGAPIGLGIAGLGMAGAVMVQAAAAHEGFVLRAAADPHAAPRAAFARDFNARTYEDIAALCADPAVEV